VKSKLVDANLTNAILKSARLVDINMSGANLMGADISGAAMRKNKLCRVTMPDGTKTEEGCDK